MILIQYWGSLSPAGFSTKQRLGGIWLLVYHLNECQRSASGQMEAEQMALYFFLTAPINAKTLSLRQKSTVVAKCPLDAPPHNERIEFLCSENYLDQDFLVLFS